MVVGAGYAPMVDRGSQERAYSAFFGGLLLYRVRVMWVHVCVSDLGSKSLSGDGW